MPGRTLLTLPAPLTAEDELPWPVAPLVPTPVMAADDEDEIDDEEDEKDGVHARGSTRRDVSLQYHDT